jgi:hypothetical protein
MGPKKRGRGKRDRFSNKLGVKRVHGFGDKTDAHLPTDGGVDTQNSK